MPDRWTRDSPADWVDPLIGTDSAHAFSNGNTYPVVAMPWGMAAWTPQTQDDGWTYRYRDAAIQGIRLTHQPSPWIGDYGRITFSPQTLGPDGRPQPDAAARASAFSRRTERARPYAYDVRLDRYDMRVEITPTERCGVLRITFPPSEAAVLVVDTHRDGGALRWDGRQLVGFTRSNSGGVPDDFAHHIIVEFSQPPTGFADALTPAGDSLPRLAGELAWDATELAGDRVVGAVRFDATVSRTVEVRVGTSFISAEQAALNLRREVGDARLRGRSPGREADVGRAPRPCRDRRRDGRAAHHVHDRALALTPLSPRPPRARRHRRAPTTGAPSPAACTTARWSPTTGSGIRFGPSTRSSRFSFPSASRSSSAAFSTRTARAAGCPSG